MFLVFFSVTTWTSGQRGHASRERLGHKFSRLDYWAEPGFQAPLKSYPKNVFSRGRASEAATFVSHPFAFVFSWYKVIIALSFFFSTGALQHTAHKSIIAAKTVPLKIVFRAPTGLEAQQKQQYRSGQHKMQTADRVQNADCRLQTGNKMSFYKLLSVTQSLFRDHPLRNILITIVLNTVSSLHIVFSLCARVGWCDVCTEFTNLIGRCRYKWDVTIKYLTCAMFVSSFNPNVYTHWFSHMCPILQLCNALSWPFIPLLLYAHS